MDRPTQQRTAVSRGGLHATKDHRRAVDVGPPREQAESDRRRLYAFRQDRLHRRSSTHARHARIIIYY